MHYTIYVKRITAKYIPLKVVRHFRYCIKAEAKYRALGYKVLAIGM